MGAHPKYGTLLPCRRTGRPTCAMASHLCRVVVTFGLVELCGSVDVRGDHGGPPNHPRLGTQLVGRRPGGRLPVFVAGRHQVTAGSYDQPASEASFPYANSEVVSVRRDDVIDDHSVGRSEAPHSSQGPDTLVASSRDHPSSRSRRSSRHWLAVLIAPCTDVLAVAGGTLPVVRSSVFPALYGLLVLALLSGGAPRHARLGPEIGDDVPDVVRSVAVSLLVLSPWLAASAQGPQVLRQALILLPVIVFGRCLAHLALVALRRQGVLAEPTLIVGAGEVGQRLAEAFCSDRTYGLDPVGFLEDNPYDRLPLPVLGKTSDLVSVLERTGARRVVVAFGSARDATTVSVLRACDDALVQMHLLPRFFELGFLPRSSEVDEVRGIPVVRLRRTALRPSSRAVKRAFDVGLAGLTLLISSPIIFLVALGVRLSSPGPVLFRQKRVGRDGRPFDLLKFRSMRINEDSDTTWEIGGDPRITRFGAFIRRSCLDELPQFWNVVCGDMSLVGPRPERPHFVKIFDQSVPGYGDRHRVASGMTGWSQVHGLRGDTSIIERAVFDNYYVENWSLWLDIRVLVRTMHAVVVRPSPRGAKGGQLGTRSSDAQTVDLCDVLPVGGEVSLRPVVASDVPLPPPA